MKSQIKAVFVSNVNILKPKGGWDGLGASIYELLKEDLNGLSLCDSINPASPSKFSRVANALMGFLFHGKKFLYFSTSRLTKIAIDVNQKLNSRNDLILFHGSTPWVKVNPKDKYVVFTDCSFATYISVYHDIRHFSKSDIAHITALDKQFVKSAALVFTTSQWAANEMLRDYALNPEKVVVCGQGPSIIPSQGFYEVDRVIENRFLFIASDFYGKGGALIYNALLEFVKEFPNYKLTIVGAKPPVEIVSSAFVEYVGFVDKSTKAGLDKMESLYATSKAILLLTTKDAAPLVLVEAAYFGCPAIANHFSAIPELIQDGLNGYLVELNKESLVESFHKLARLSGSDYIEMRTNAQNIVKQKFNWDITKKRILGAIAKI